MTTTRTHATHSSVHNVEQLLHYHGGALVTKQPGHARKVLGTNKLLIGAEDRLVGFSQCLGEGGERQGGEGRGEAGREEEGRGGRRKGGERGGREWRGGERK